MRSWPDVHAGTLSGGGGRKTDNGPMSDIELFNPPGLAPPVGFAHAAAAGDLVAQFARAIRNVATALEAAGSRPDRALKLTYFVADAAAYRAGLEAIGAA